jgi:hypothetical protein
VLLAAEIVILVTLAKLLTGLNTLELAGVELTTELDTLELASPQATKVSVKTEVVTNLKIFFILKNHLLGTLYIKLCKSKILFVIILHKKRAFIQCSLFL